MPMELNDAAQMRRLLTSRLANTDEQTPRPLALREFPVPLERLLGKGFERTLRPAGVLVPIMDRPTGLSVMLTRRSDELRSHAGQIAFPGGSREEDDASLAETALREAHEEVGLEPARVSLLGYLDNYPTISGFLITPVVGLVKADEAIVRPDGIEVTEILEVPLARVLDRQCYEKGSIERLGVRLPFYTLEYGQHRIWGATAGMLLNLRAKLLEPQHGDAHRQE